MSVNTDFQNNGPLYPTVELYRPPSGQVTELTHLIEQGTAAANVTPRGLTQHKVLHLTATVLCLGSIVGLIAFC